MGRGHRVGMVQGVALWVAIASPLANAHDFWMELSRYHVEPGAAVDVSLRVGHGAEVTRYPRKPSHIDWFAVEREGARAPVQGAVGAEPAGRAQFAQPGLYAVGYRSTPTFIELDAKKFESYLEHEGLKPIIEERRRLGQSAEPGRELYSRCAKSFVRVGDAPVQAADYTQPMGMPLEFTPMSDPSAIQHGERFGVQLTFNGQPLPGARVDAMHWASQTAEPVTLIGETDANGEVSFEFTNTGTWVIASTYMFEASADDDADWESLWATLTVDVAANASAKP